MWTTSSSRAERARCLAAGALLTTLLSAGSACSPARAAVPPEAPRPARDTLALARRSVPSRRMEDRPVELRAVLLTRVRSDTALVRLAGPARLQRSPDLVALVVNTVEPIPLVARDAALEVYVGGERADDTWVVPPNRLVAFVAAPQRLLPGIEVTAAWTGAEEQTRSRRPLVLTAEHLRGLR